MILSRIALDANNRETLRALGEPQLLHGAVEHSFAGDRSRRLWRVDWLNDRCFLLVLSQAQPDFTHIAAQFGSPRAPASWESKNYDLLLARLQVGQTWRFRLRANPVRSSTQLKKSPSSRGKVVAHVTQEYQKQWLAARAPAHGFSLEDGKYDVVHTQWMRFSKGSQRGEEVTLRTASFEGALTITDVEQFRQALVSGIGRAKAYGCGLLTVARIGGGVDA